MGLGQSSVQHFLLHYPVCTYLQSDSSQLPVLRLKPGGGSRLLTLTIYINFGSFWSSALSDSCLSFSRLCSSYIPLPPLLPRVLHTPFSPAPPSSFSGEICPHLHLSLHLTAAVFNAYYSGTYIFFIFALPSPCNSHSLLDV